MMKGDTNAARLEGEAAASAHICPEHGHRMVPIHRVSGGQRSVVGWTCPEPYCEHAEVDPRLVDDPEGAPWGDAR